MLIFRDFQDLLTANPAATADEFLRLLSPPIKFSQIDNFPTERGIYFLYIANISRPLYIGSAYESNRNLKKRCMQYLQNGSGGNSFTGRIARLKNIPRTEAIEFVRANIFARFIVEVDLDKATIKQREMACIWALQPPLNFINHT